MPHRLALLLLLCPLLGQAQHTDTLRYTSAAFGTERTVVVHLPEFHRYASPEVRMPVIILLDGQHDWFVEPLLNDIRYLQYTHEVPQAIVVTIPLADRVQESAPDSLDQPALPLLRMLTEELPALLGRYNPGDLQVLVGHSFTSSFALYAYLQAPASFDAVIALSPLHLVKRSLPRVAKELALRPTDRVLVAVGGAAPLQDGGHHASIVSAMAAVDPTLAGDRLLLREYPSAGHTSLPIIAFPELLATLFMPYAVRDSLAPVNGEYKLTSVPPSPEVLMERVAANCRFGNSVLPWDVAEINGLASRLHGSGYLEQATAVYRRAVQLYPRLYEFHWSLGELLLEQDHPDAMKSLQEALRLLDGQEPGLPERMEIRGEIEALMR
jgi:enterochelin esterase-like enzyme